MIKAIFFDIDGTLVPLGQEFISDRLEKDLPALQAQGIKIFVCSGRARQDLNRTGMLRGVEFDGYLTLSGQYCCDKDGAAYRDVAISPEDARGACQVLLDHPEIPALMQGNGESYLTRINDRVERIYKLIHTVPYPRRSPEWLLEGKTDQLTPFAGPGEEELFLAAMPGCASTRWHSEGIDILPRDGGKGVAIQATMERYGFTREELMAFGDGENDMPMLAQTGTSVAMGNSVDKVKAMASYVTDTARSDGISKALRHFGLLPG